MRFAKVDQKLKHVKQKFNQSIDELITHIKKLKTQLFKLSEKYQKYSNFLHALHSHFRKTMLKNHFDIFFRRKLKKLIQKFEHIEILFEKRKIDDFDDRVRKNKFFYRQSNVDNVNKNDNVQSAINRNELKNKKNDANIVKDEISHKKSKNLEIKIS